MSRRSPLVLLAILCAASASLLLAACGGSSPSSTDPSAQAKEQQAEVKFADFAKCLREHGVNAEAISHPGGGHGLKVSPGQAGAGPAAMEAPQMACKKYQPEPQKVNLSPQQKVEQEEAVQKFARCMREHGIKVEATSNGGGVQIAIHVHPGEAGAPNPESPAFQTAQKDCQRLLPGPPKGGPGSPGAPATSSEGGGKPGSGASLAIGG